MKKVVLLVTTLLVLLAVNFLIANKEKSLASGHTMLLELAPRDPRSLMQGDYMVLRYAIARDVARSQLAREGRIVVTLDHNNVARFIRVYEGEKLHPREHLLQYTNHRGLHLGAETFMFQEGDAPLYSTARYGELCVTPAGQPILVGLRDDKFRRIERE